MAALLGATGAAVGVFAITRGADAVGCEERLLASAAAALAGTVLALCVFRGGLFLLGATAFGAVAHVVYEALVASGTVSDASAPRVLGRSAYHYAAVGGGALVGAVATCAQRKHFVRVVTSLLAGGCLVLAAHVALSTRQWQDVSSWAPPAIVGVTAVAGTLAQGAWARRARRRRGHAKRPRRERDVHSLPSLRRDARRSWSEGNGDGGGGGAD
jgi:hypothetical protein